MIAGIIGARASHPAARAARRLHQQLGRLGVEGQLLELPEPGPSRSEGPCAGPGVRFSEAGPGLDLSDHPLVRGADLIHLGDVTGLLAPGSLRSLSDLGKPIVWSLPDARPFTGGCHAVGTCDRFESSCAPCPLFEGESAQAPSRALHQALEHLVPGQVTVVVGSAWQARRVRRSLLLGASRVCAIAPGVDPERFAPWTRDETRRELGLAPGRAVVLVDLSALGRPGPAARQLGEAVARLPTGGFGPQLLLLGAESSPSGFTVLSLADPLEEGARARLFAAADLTLVPDGELDRPDGLLEAMACGAPVIAPEDSLAAEFLEDGAEGWLVPATPEAMASALGRALAEPDERVRRGAAARRRVLARHPPEREANAYLALFEELLLSRTPRRSAGPAAPRQARASGPPPPSLAPPAPTPRALAVAPNLSPARAPWPRATPPVPPLPAAAPGGRAWPRISVVMPSLNQGAYVEEAILSVLNQGYPDVELLVVDGGSTDETPEILARYRSLLADCRSEPDAGQSHALNKGFARATGELLTWLNSDDMLAPGALAGVALAFQDPTVDLVAGICEVYQEGELVRRHLTACGDGPLSLEQLLDLPGHWIPGQFFYQPEVFFRRRLWERAGGCVDGSLRYCMDYDLWARFALAGARLRVVGRPVARFRSHRAQKTAEQATFLPELELVADRYRAGSPAPAPPPTWRRGGLRVAVVGAAGFGPTEGITLGRMARALTLAGHEVLPLAAWNGALRPAPPPEPLGRQLRDRLSALAPDAILLGDLGAAPLEPGALAGIASVAPTVLAAGPAAAERGTETAAGRAPRAALRALLPLDVFQPRDPSACRERLGLPQDRFLVLFPTDRPGDTEPGTARLLEGLRAAALPGALALGLGPFEAADRRRFPEVHFLGPAEDELARATVLSAADLVVVPGPREPSGVLLAEAAACGTPAIICAVGEDRGVPGEGPVGCLMPDPAPGGLARALRGLHDQPVLRRELSALARLEAENELSFELAYRDLFLALQEALGARGPRLPPRISLLRRSAGPLPEPEYLLDPGAGPPPATSGTPSLPPGAAERTVLAYFTEQLVFLRMRRLPWILNPRAWWARVNRQLMRRALARVKRGGA